MSEQEQQEKGPQRRRRPYRRQPSGLRQRRLAIGFVVIALIAMVVVVVRNVARPSLAGVTSADTGNATLVATGRQLYVTRCASCHGIDLEGDPAWPHRQQNGLMPASPLSARGQVKQQDDSWIFRTIKEGGQATGPSGYSSAMPPFGSALSDAQIWAWVPLYQKHLDIVACSLPRCGLHVARIKAYADNHSSHYTTYMHPVVWLPARRLLRSVNQRSLGSIACSIWLRHSYRDGHRPSR